MRHWPVTTHSDLNGASDLNGPSNLNGVVVLVHGLGEHIGRYESVAQVLNRAGWAVVGYDQRGHGRSEGDRGVIRQNDDLLHDLATVLDAVSTATTTSRLALLGHSLGGLIVARFVAALASPVEQVEWRRAVDLCILSSPALKIRLSRFQKILLSIVVRIAPDLRVSNGLNADWLSTDPSAVEAYQNDPLVHHQISGRLTQFMLSAGEAVSERSSRWSVPTLLLYSGLDQCVSPEGSKRFASSLPTDLLHTIEYAQMRHEIFNELDRNAVFQDLVAWLNRQSDQRTSTIDLSAL